MDARRGSIWIVAALGSILGSLAVLQPLANGSARAPAAEVALAQPEFLLAVSVRKPDGTSFVATALWSDGTAIVSYRPSPEPQRDPWILDIEPEAASRLARDVAAGRFDPLSPAHTVQAFEVTTRVFEDGAPRIVQCDVERLGDALHDAARTPIGLLDEPLARVLEERSRFPIHRTSELEGTPTGFAVGRRTDGLRDSEWILLQPGLRPDEAGEYRRGRRHGTWKQWGVGGELVARSTFDRGRPHGPHVEYWTSGIVRTRGTHVDGRRDGEWTYFDEKGSVARRITYAKGAVTSDER